jgi:hypothetical protein
MLVYHPAFDAYHCVMRLLAILRARPVLERDTIRILDFGLCFPAVVAQFRLPQKLSKLRRAAKDVHNDYRTPISARSTFTALSNVHDGALSCLGAAGLVDADQLKAGTVARTTVALPSDVEMRCISLEDREAFFFKDVLPVLAEIPLSGPDGLKDRSGLVEHRYDVA